jgi:hypothetical protein
MTGLGYKLRAVLANLTLDNYSRRQKEQDEFEAERDRDHDVRVHAQNVARPLADVAGAANPFLRG